MARSNEGVGTFSKVLCFIGILFSYIAGQMLWQIAQDFSSNPDLGGVIALILLFGLWYIFFVVSVFFQLLGQLWKQKIVFLLLSIIGTAFNLYTILTLFTFDFAISDTYIFLSPFIIMTIMTIFGIANLKK
ncbi:MAG: hypothetical protein OEY49_18650 [Candidatus Heimdallarchaeota archaeon]|nr:hypothetical protein [Candidatus Heimdallarchaeota archaeon]